MVLLFIYSFIYATVVDVQSIVTNSTIAVVKEKTQAAKFHELQKLKKNLQKIKSKDIEKVMYKNGILVLLENFNEDLVMRKDCQQIVQSINSKVTDESNRPQYYKDSVKLAGAICK